MKISKNEFYSIAKHLRCEILEMINKAGSGHPGGSLSVIDIILYLYSNEMRQDPNNPKWPARDRFVLSKGHGVPALYAVLAYLGYFPKEELATLRKIGSPLQGHPANQLLPGIEASTGSLGQGLSVALGMALAGRLKNPNKPAFDVYAVLGDGEIQEGQIWEAAMCAGHYQVDNMLVFIDRNKGQIDGMVDDIMTIEPLEDKFSSFGWQTLRIDGHDFDSLALAVKTFHDTKNKPTVIIADTIKGKGVSFMEKDTISWHGKSLNDDELARALVELSEAEHD